MDDLIRRAGIDDREAWQFLFDTCNSRMVRAIRDRTRMQACDAEDLASEAFGRLASKVVLINFDGPDALVAYLVADALSGRTR